MSSKNPSRSSSAADDHAIQGPVTRSRAKQLAAAVASRRDFSKERRGTTNRQSLSDRKLTTLYSPIADIGSAFPVYSEAQLAVQMAQVAIDNAAWHSESPGDVNSVIAPSVQSTERQGHAEDRTPRKARKERERFQCNYIAKSSYESAQSTKSSQQHARTPTAGNDSSWGMTGKECDAIIQEEADRVARSTQDISLDQMLAMTKRSRQISKVVDAIASDIETVFSSQKHTFTEWIYPASTERKVYGYFADFVLFVAQRVKEHHLGTSGWQLVLPSQLTDYSPQDSNSDRRLDVSLFLADTQDEVVMSKKSSYAEMFAVVEVKRGNSNTDKIDALSQLFCYSQNIYTMQLNRRFLWGLTICASSVCAELMLHDKVLVSSTMDITTTEGRKQLVSLLVHWSACSMTRLGYDPSIRRRSLSHVADYQGTLDNVFYDIDCYDDDTKEKRTYTTLRTISEASCLFGRHTRTMIARPANSLDDSSQEVVIKDAWARYNVDEDNMRNEIGLLRTVRETFKDKPVDFLYPKLEVGGTVKLDGNTDDTTAAILDKLDNWEQLDIPLRVHRRIVTTPLGHSIKLVKDENELVIVLAEAMRCHNALVQDCGILHRDISLGNILAVSTGLDRKELHGLLIDLDSAIRTDGVERTAGAERSGTLPYMSIANLENLDTDRTALDDWESLLYVVCWVATFGVVSEDRRNPSDKATINSWNVDEKQAAEAKRGHMHSSDNFEGDVIKGFLPGYRLLKVLAKGLHQVLFLHPGCEGARFNPSADEEFPSLDLPNFLSNAGSLPKSDPLLERSKHMDAIVHNLVLLMESAEKIARARLTK